jgi:hypothetical protein|tara:strand:+ start:231 stop:473 length:243 start_codon:yes stop_codon:yes gene_type:complete
MLITKKSLVTGNITTKDIDVSLTQLNAWENGALIQDAMPQVSLSDREFIKTGITNDEWNNLFKETKHVSRIKSTTSLEET